jgi:predicted transcriptional regulator of viral defense system
MRVSSTEATAFELVGYADECGGLDNVISVLAELAEALDGKKLATVARLSPVAWAQRLGYLLDLIQQDALADALLPYVRDHAAAIAPLVRKESTARAERINRWKLAINVQVEPDL